MRTHFAPWVRSAALAVLIGALAVVAAPSGFGLPAQSQGQNSQFTLEGKITNLSAGKATVSTEDNIIFHVAYDEKTQIHRKDGSAGSAKDLAAGETIKVVGMLTPEGIIEAQQIDIE